MYKLHHCSHQIWSSAALGVPISLSTSIRAPFPSFPFTFLSPFDPLIEPVLQPFPLCWEINRLRNLTPFLTLNSRCWAKIFNAIVLNMCYHILSVNIHFFHFPFLLLVGFQELLDAVQMVQYYQAFCRFIFLFLWPAPFSDCFRTLHGLCSLTEVLHLIFEKIQFDVQEEVLVIATKYSYSVLLQKTHPSSGLAQCYSPNAVIALWLPALALLPTLGAIISHEHNPLLSLRA